MSHASIAEDDRMRSAVSPTPRVEGENRIRGRTAEKPALFIAALAMLVLATSSASAVPLGQIVESLGGSGGVGARVDDESVGDAIEDARRSFEHAARDRADSIVADADGAPVDPGMVDRRIAESTDAFVEHAQARLIEERGDGLLTWNEVTQVLSEERQSRLDALAEALHAALDGADSPPTREEFASESRWAFATARYILLDRNAPTRWLLCGVFLVMSLVLAGFAARGLEAGAERLAGHGASGVARAARSLSGPFYLAAAAIGVRVALGWVWLPVGMAEGLRQGATAMVAISLLWLGWSAADGMANLIAWTANRTRGRVDDELIDLARKGFRIAVLVAVAGMLVNTVLGVELSSILATVGVIGIVVSVAAQDTLRNLIGAFTVYGDGPFAVGDLIRIKSYFGKVEAIGFRSTRLRTLDGHLVLLPNATVVRDAVENVSARPSVRHHYALDLVYATPPDRVLRAVELLEEILENADPPEGQPPRVSFETFGSHSLRIEVWYYSNTSDYWEARAHRTSVNAEILERFNEEGLEFAFPTSSIHLQTTRDESEEKDDDAGE